MLGLIARNLSLFSAPSVFESPGRRVHGLGRRLLREGAGFASMQGGQRLEKKVVLITGGVSGLGQAAVHEFVQLDARVIVADIDSQLGSREADELSPQAMFIPCGVTLEQWVADAVDFAVVHHDKLDVMYNNAGIPGPSVQLHIADVNLAQFY